MADLARIKRLKPGWYGPGSLPPAPLAVTNFEEFQATIGANCPEPLPSTDGCVCIEWDRGDWSYGVDFRPDGDVLMLSFGPVDDDEREAVRDFDSAALLAFYRDGWN